MNTPLPYLQLIQHFRPFIQPQDQRHLTVFSEIIAAIVLSGSATISHWLPFLSHRHCHARSHMARLSYFLLNPNISPSVFYLPLLQFFLQSWHSQPIVLALDTSVLWDKFCLIEVSFAWGGRSFCLAQKVIEHNSATVGFADYVPVLEMARKSLPPNCQVTFLADRGFEHTQLIHWLNNHHWSWYIRAKSDLSVKGNGYSQPLSDLCPKANQVHLFCDVTILDGIKCNLGIANEANSKEDWAVITNEPLSLQTFAVYGKRFGGIEPHFKDYKSACFDLLNSKFRNAQGLTNLLMLISVAELIALSMALLVMKGKELSRFDWHSKRGLSFLNLGMRKIQSMFYEGNRCLYFQSLPRINPPPACASKKKAERQRYGIEFDKVVFYQ